MTGHKSRSCAKNQLLSCFVVWNDSWAGKFHIIFDPNLPNEYIERKSTGQCLLLLEYRRDSGWFMAVKMWHKIPDIECWFTAENLHFGVNCVLTITKHYRNHPNFLIMMGNMYTFPAYGSLNIPFSIMIHGLIFSHSIFLTYRTNLYKSFQSRSSDIDPKNVIFR